MPKSELELELLFQIQAVGLPDPVKERRFCPGRRWRFDFAWNTKRLAVEIEGGTWSGGRHVRGKGFQGDCEKYNEAALRNWRVLRFTGAHIKSGYALQMIERGLNL